MMKQLLAANSSSLLHSNVLSATPTDGLQVDGVIASPFHDLAVFDRSRLCFPYIPIAIGELLAANAGSPSSLFLSMFSGLSIIDSQ